MAGPPSLVKVRRAALLLAALAGAGVATYSVVDYLAYDKSREEESLAVGRTAGIRVAEALDAKPSSRSSRERGRLCRPKSPKVDSVTARLLESIREGEPALGHSLMGVTVAFEPGAFAGKARYAPFFNKDS